MRRTWEHLVPPIARNRVFWPRKHFHYNSLTVRGLVGTDWPAQADHQIRISDRAVCQVVNGCLAEGDVPPLPLHNRREKSQIFERHMAQGYSGASRSDHRKEPVLRAGRDGSVQFVTICASWGPSEASASASLRCRSRGIEKHTLNPSVVHSVIMPVLGSDDRSTVHAA